MKNIFSFLLADGYKLGHSDMFVEGTNEVYGNFTPRGKKIYELNSTEFYDGKVVFVGLQGALKEIQENFEVFFKMKRKEVSNEIKTYVSTYVANFDSLSIEKRFLNLHDLGYLPVEIRALKEGSRVNVGVPLFTIRSTHKDFSWLVGYLETIISCLVWKPIYTATVSYEFLQISKYYNGGDEISCWFQNHDFSMRGMSGPEDAARCGFAFLTSSYGSDSLPSIWYAKHYYEADPLNEIVCRSVPATEHSVAGNNIIYNAKTNGISLEEAEEKFVSNYLTMFPTGIISYVADTFDFWNLISDILVKLKDKIVKRYENDNSSKLVIRPDSGVPLHIICGDPSAPEGSLQYKGALEVLWEIFGGSGTKEKGNRLLHGSIGLIYGDSITRKSACEILETMRKKGFKSSNIVFGVGSYTMNYSTRDVFSMAVKATNTVINGKEYPIYKDPKTDQKKKSAKGYLKVIKINREYALIDNVTFEESQKGELVTIYKEGLFLRTTSLDEIRKELHN